jgi:cytochrome P450
MVFLCMGSANRDPEQFPDPDTFRLDRPVTKLLSFGSGPHFCIGSILARQETSLALETLLARFPNLRLDPDRPAAFTHQAGMRGPCSLPICF